jgi:heat shock protein HslJ
MVPFASRSDAGASLLFLLVIVLAGEVGAQVVGDEWRPTEIVNVAIRSDTSLFVRFTAAGKLEGYGGCNKFFGTYSSTEVGIYVGPLGATRMACAEPIMTRESAFLAALGNAKRYDRRGVSLIFYDEGGKIVVRFTQNGTE